MAKNSTASSADKEIADHVFDYIVAYSQENLCFPMASEMSEHFGFSGTRVHAVVEKLVKQQRVEKIGRYNFKIAKAHLPK